MVASMASCSLLQSIPCKTQVSSRNHEYSSKMQVCTRNLQEQECSRRQALLSSASCLLLTGIQMVTNLPAYAADVLDEYKSDTQAVINKVKETLALEKTDPTKPTAVANLRQSSNSWVAKYRREKAVAGKPSFSNMYSVLNAISGHYISFGPASSIPAKRQQRILEEVTDAEKALKRGR